MNDLARAADRRAAPRLWPALYRWLTAAAAPLVRLYLGQRCRRGKEDVSRLGERFNAQTLSALSKPEQTAFLQMLVRLVEAHKNGF